MLTKNCPKDNTSASDSKKLGEVRDSLKANADAPCPFYQLQNQAHRKSFEAPSVPGSSSPSASNPSTASSSPITKPRAQQKGKENISGSGNCSSGNSNSSTRRSTPVVTPVHQSQDRNGTKKSQPNGTTCWIKKLSGNKVTGDKINGNFPGVPGGHGKGASQDEFLENLMFPKDPEDKIMQQTPAPQVNGDDKNGGSGNGGSNKKKVKRRFSSNAGSTSDFAVQSSNNASGSDRRLSGCESKGGNSSNAASNSSRRGNIGKSEKLRSRKDGNSKFSFFYPSQASSTVWWWRWPCHLFPTWSEQV